MELENFNEAINFLVTLSSYMYLPEEEKFTY